MPLVPHRFLFRTSYPCKHVADMPGEEDTLLELPGECRIDNFSGMDEQKNFAEVYLAWNETGIGLQAEVKGKDQLPEAEGQPGSSDGLTLWIDTRDARASHRASRYCHQFHFLPTGGGADHDEPSFSQSKINRALQDAPLCDPNSVPFRITQRKTGYRLEAFLPAGVLNGYDPEQYPRLGFYYVVRDAELGEQFLSVGSEFPYWEDPSLWSVLELRK